MQSTKRPGHVGPSTALVGFVVMVAIVLVNLQPTLQRQSSEALSYPSGWYQGWPFWFVHGWAPADPPIRLVQFDYFNVDVLLADLLIGLAVIYGSCATWRRWLFLRRIQLQLSLQSLLAITAWCGCSLIAFREWGYPWKAILFAIANVITYAAVAAAWLSTIRFAGVASSWTVQQVAVCFGRRTSVP